VPTTLINLQNSHISDAVTEIMLSKLVFFGTPIMNSRMLPSMGGFLTYLKGLKPKNRYAFTFGSYGWSSAGFKEVEASIEEAGMELKAFGAYFQFIPGEDELNSLKELAQTAVKSL
jgi:flavorubredoxin